MAKPKTTKAKNKAQKKKNKKAAKTTAKKTKTSKKKTAKKATQPAKQGLIGRLFKWCIVLGLWGGIFLGGLIAWYGTELPDIIESPTFERSASTQILSYDREDLVNYGQIKGGSVHVSELPDHVAYAVISIEDRRFYRHFGIDPIGIARAMAINIMQGGLRQGGSTITQQLAKNLFLTHERTIKRKIQEAMISLWLEKEFSKDEIISAYLNRVYFGAGAYGIEAAAQVYFKKSATELNVYESALLAGLLKAPSRYSPHANPDLARKRARTVLNAMEDNGYDFTNQETTPSTIASLPYDKKNTSNIRYFADIVMTEKEDLIGKLDQDITIQTTLVPALQDAADRILKDNLQRYEDRHVTQGAIVVMDFEGAVLALSGGVDFRTSQFNRATQARRASGSAFKPVVYLTALENGWDKDSMILDAPIENGDYHPENFKDEYLGKVTLETALLKSLNTAAVRLAKDVGTRKIINTAKTLGIDSTLANDLSMALGSSGISLMEMTRAYGAIGNGGYRIDPYFIFRVEDAKAADDEKIIYQKRKFDRDPRAIKASAAKEMKQMLRSVIEDGTGKRAALPFDTYGKTGTSQYYRDAWFVGFTDKFVAGVWVGNDDNSPMQGVTGGSLPAEIWHDVMLTAHKQEGISPLSDTSHSPSDRSSFTRFLDRILNN